MNVIFAIGCKRYSDPEVAHLSYADRDASRFVETLMNTQDSNSTEEYLLHDDHEVERFHPTRSNILRFLWEGANRDKSTELDFLFFYFSGHGWSSQDGTDYLLTSDSTVVWPEETAISVPLLEKRLKNWGARHVVLFIDACRSVLSGGKGLTVQEESRIDVESLTLPGMVTFCSCQPGQISYEADAIGSGVFTEGVCRALGDEGRCTTIQELNEYLNAEIPKISREYAQPPQEPYSRVEPLGVENAVIVSQRIREAWQTQERRGAKQSPSMTTQEEQLGKYREFVEWVWRGERLSDRDVEWLSYNADRLDLSYTHASTVEREVMGETKEEILQRQERETRKSARELNARETALRDTEEPDLDHWQAYDQGRKYMNKGEWEQALRSYEQVHRVMPRHVGAWMGKSSALLRLGRNEEALEAADRAISVRPDRVDARINKCDVLLRLGRNEEALEAADEAISVKPHDIKAWINKSDVLLRLGRNEEALEAADEAISVKPHDINAWINKSGLLLRLGRNEEALEAADRAISVEPHDVNAWINKSIALRKLGRNEEELATWERFIEVRPDFVDSWINKSGALLRLGRNEEALEAADRAISVRPDLVDSWINKSDALLRLGRNEEALEAADRAISARPDRVDALVNKSNALLELGRNEEALATIDEAIALREDHWGSWYYRGWLLHRLGRNEEALTALNEASKRESGHPLLWRLMGNTLENLGRAEEAAEAYDKAKTLEQEEM